MRILWLEIDGWMPFESQFRLDLPAGPIAVVGTHSGDPRRSNRAGKTSLLEAVTWCLYGVHRKRVDDAIINRAASSCTVAIGFEGLLVRRSRARGSSTKLEVQTGTTLYTGEAAQNAVVATVGLTLHDYLATSCFRQGDVESLISRTSAERLALVSEWLQQTRWAAAKMAQASKVNGCELRLAEKRAMLRAIEVDLLTDPERDETSVALDKLEAAKLVLERELRELTEELLEIVAIDHKRKQLQELNQLRTKAVQLKSSLSSSAEVEQTVKEATELVAGLRSQVDGRSESLRDLVRSKVDGFSGICPVTCQACPVSKSVDSELAKSAKLEEVKRAELDVVWAAHSEALTVENDAKSKLAAIQRTRAEYTACVGRGKELAAVLAGFEDVETRSAEPIQAEADEKRSRLAQTNQQIGDLLRQRANDEQADQRRTTLLVEVERAERAAVVAKLAHKALAGVPARVAAQQLGELEREANHLLEGTGVSLRFSWQRELADKTPTCDECGHVYVNKRGDQCPACNAPRGKKLAQELELLCDDGSGTEEDARFNSGGTRAIVGSAVRLAASAMLRRLRSSRAAWAVVDEPFGSLDAENREQLARTFAGMLGSVGLEQALVVSHDPALLAALPHRIVIDKDGDKSTARVE